MAHGKHTRKENSRKHAPLRTSTEQAHADLSKAREGAAISTDVAHGLAALMATKHLHAASAGATSYLLAALHQMCGPWQAHATREENKKNAPLLPPKEEPLAVPATSSSAVAVLSLKAAPPLHSDTDDNAAQLGKPTERQRCIGNSDMVSQPGSASACKPLCCATGNTFSK